MNTPTKADAVAQQAIIEFLATQALTHGLGEAEELAAVAEHAQLLDLPAGENHLLPDDAQAYACLVMDGMVVVRAEPEPFVLAEGSGVSLLKRRPTGKPTEITAVDASRLLLLEESAYPEAPDSLPGFSELLTSLHPLGIDREHEKRERDPTSSAKAASTARQRLVHLPVADIMTRNPIVASPDMSIHSVAVMMANHKISCIPIIDDSGLVGLVTESDITSRVVAVQGALSDPVSRIMTRELATVAQDDLVFAALNIVSQRGVAHVPVIDQGRLVGIVTQTDIVRRQTASVVYLVADIERLGSAEAIADVTARIPTLMTNLVESGATAVETGQVLTTITDTVTRRLIALAMEELGEAPVPFAWAACGSQGRQEQTSATDQDNCVFIDDRYDEASHGAWFKAFSEHVCRGLDVAGYEFCPGDMMAMNERWCQPVSVWKQYFDEWINKPTPESQMLASVMFDLRVIYGDKSLLSAVQDVSVPEASTNSIFVAHLLSNSLKHRPPIGFFGQMATERSGPHRHTIDLKHSGVVPINDLARVHALTVASRDVSTSRRLEAEGENGLLSDSARSDLLGCFEYINLLRMRHQAAQVRKGREPDSYLDPDELTRMEREQLKDCFVRIKQLQSAMSSRQGVL